LASLKGDYLIRTRHRFVVMSDELGFVVKGV
jgi:hypothetical protein